MVGISRALVSRWWRGYGRRRRGEHGTRARQELADALPHVIWGTSTDGRCEFLNDRYTETFGISRSNAIKNQSWVDPIHPADLEKMHRSWRYAIGEGNSFYSALARMRMNDGSYRWMESIGRPVRSTKTDDTLKCFGSLIDVQNQVEDRETIARLQFDLQVISDDGDGKSAGDDARLTALFETRQVGWIEYDVSSVSHLSETFRTRGISDVDDYLRENPAEALELSKGLRLLNASPYIVSLLGFENVESLASENTRVPRAANEVESAILTALIGGFSTTCGIARLADAGGRLQVLPFTMCISKEGTARAVFVDFAMAEERAKEASKARIELARVNRVAAASALSASLIHQISQPITAISLDLATATRLITSGESYSEAVAKVMDRLRWNTQRLSDVGTSTRETLSNAPKTLEAVDIADLARKAYRFLIDPLESRRESFRIVADDDLPIVLADRVALQQVLFALLQNAFDAHELVGERADITVTISSGGSREVKVEVADRGPGISSEQIALVFDPFFSTKDNRLGFGLTISQSVVEGFGGALTLSNRPGGGVSAEFTIPAR